MILGKFLNLLVIGFIFQNGDSIIYIIGLLWGSDENKLLNIVAQHVVDAQHMLIESKSDFWNAICGKQHTDWRKFVGQLFLGSNPSSISNFMNLDKFCSLITRDNDIYLASPHKHDKCLLHRMCLILIYIIIINWWGTRRKKLLDFR